MFDISTLKEGEYFYTELHGVLYKYLIGNNKYACYFWSHGMDSWHLISSKGGNLFDNFRLYSSEKILNSLEVETKIMLEGLGK